MDGSSLEALRALHREAASHKARIQAEAAEAQYPRDKETVAQVMEMVKKVMHQQTQLSIKGGEVNIAPGAQRALEAAGFKVELTLPYGYVVKW